MKCLKIRLEKSHLVLRCSVEFVITSFLALFNCIGFNYKVNNLYSGGFNYNSSYRFQSDGMNMLNTLKKVLCTVMPLFFIFSTEKGFSSEDWFAFLSFI